jgi:transposase
MIPGMNKRYKEFVAAAPSPSEARRRIVEYARRHGTAAAARMSGAAPCTVYRLLKRKRLDSFDRPTRALLAEEEARIIDARLANPTEGVRSLKKKTGLPHGYVQITRVLREAGLALKRHHATRDPDFWIPICTRRVEYARYELKVAEYARAAGMTCIFSEVERIRRRLDVAKRKVEWWKKEKERRERAEKIESH